MIFLPPITDTERRFAVTSMSNAKTLLPNNADAMQRLRDEMARKRAAKRSQSVDKSKEGDAAEHVHIYTSSPERATGQKRQRKDSTVDAGKKVGPSSKKKAVETFEPDSSMVLLSSGISSFGDPVGFLSRSSEFLLDVDEEILKKKKLEDVIDTSVLSAFQALQAQLYLRDRYKSTNDKCQKLKKVNDVLKADKAKADAHLNDLEQKVSVLENNLKSMEEERDRHREESTKARAMVAEKDGQVASLEDQITSIASIAICKARAELFKEYLSGQHINWDRAEMQEVIDTCDEMLRLEGSSPEEEADAGENADKTFEQSPSVNDNAANPPID
ncbi:hypothetical protein LWI29_003774 [Acer saccharum]|uniref:Uncharacterized protein n=1 Tax=Acer saccharum TaxID=4024 RepID=A0AA39VHH9_ACESA|nr:hypothetical protein LWI29_003774 [Acer saccharum]